MSQIAVRGISAGWPAGYPVSNYVDQLEISGGCSYGYALRHTVSSRVTLVRALISLSTGYNYQRYIILNCLPLTGRLHVDPVKYALDNRMAR